MSEATKQILEEIGKLSERMTSFETGATTSGEERQSILEKMEDLNKQLLESRAAGQPNLTTGANGTDFDKREVAKALDLYLRGTDTTAMDLETRTSLSNIQDNEGGFLLQETMETEVLMNAFNPGEVESVVPVLPTGGNRAVIPSMSKPKVAWGPKNVTLTDQELAAGNVGIDIHNLRALVVIPRDTLDDSAADIVGELNAAFGRALEEARDDAYSVGTGVNMPQGFMTNTDVLANSTTTAASGLLDIDTMIQAIYKLKKTYRRNAAVACNSTTEGVMATFKDGDNQPLWRFNGADSAPNTFMGLPIINPESMDDIAASSVPVCIADFAAGYRIRQRGSIAITRLDEAFATSDQVAFIVKQRIGAQTALPEAFQVVTIKA